MRMRVPARQRGRSRRGGVRWWVVLLFFGYLAYYWFSHQEETAFTGRERLIESSMEQEAALGLQAYRQILSTEPVVQSGPLPALVQDIMQRLVVVAPRLETMLAGEGTGVRTEWDAFDWEVQVLDSPDANAFCLPGGKMAVYTGIVEIAQNDNALAAIMGHEIAHALLRHGGERMAHQKLVQVGALAAGMALGEMEPQQRMMIMAALGAGAQYGVLLPFSRDHETEADYLGLMLTAAACYDPREAIGLWQRMGEAAGGQQPPEFMSTHPGHATRIDQLQAWMPEALQVRTEFCGAGAQ